MTISGSAHIAALRLEHDTQARRIWYVCNMGWWLVVEAVRLWLICFGCSGYRVVEVVDVVEVV